MNDRVRDAFRDQARACAGLGSPLTAALCRSLPDRLKAVGGPLAARVLDWPGDPSSSADSVPLRLCGALHALVLTGAAPDLAQAYAAAEVPNPLLEDMLHVHRAAILGWLDSPPQTNEVARSAALIGAARFLRGLAPLPLRLRELGASAGLNLNFDLYHLLDGAEGVVLTPDWQGDLPQGILEVASRRGVDLNPLDPDRDGLRLRAYCWADQTARRQRLDAALDLARRDPPRVDRGDAGDWLTDQLARPAPGVLTMVFHTIAAQYFPPATRAMCQAALARAGAAATPEAPLAHVEMEADGGEGAALRLTLWDGQRRHWALGRADFHGRWIRWQPQQM
ncbi:DUF2332 domain-containing protein [Paracoccus gahaiensis]|uniref:DUF2332 domain-containing protein n=1 Tax=Paracoccus gahaiensis TaxID=1706839 RepID=A0A4U0RFA3_9RHOB|nr:DUF2332 domain-containing protein [Paracoccus gahaiensis]TJZ94161.1 DUF2332 domain-containing protein [Paracoccus gahaiensis]